MRCGHCPSGTMRLVRFEAGREVWKCRQCGVESLSLDCALCEQRAVRRMADRGGLQRWACSRCRVDQYPCPACRQGWVRNLDAPQGCCCDRCDRCWSAAADGEGSLFAAAAAKSAIE